ncbi:hypothetical protein H6762_01985 [Candidatus Nomurabacteria bacterium]|nr:hypothetical protein [Candidatus Nomurabacteria bacterium]
MTDEHAEIYLSLLQYGPSTASAISKRTKIPRTTIYDAVQTLEDWDLLSKDVGVKTAVFKAHDPDLLLEQVQYKRNRISDTAYTLERSIHQLELLYARQQSESPPIRVLVGKEGLKDAYDDVYRSKELMGIAYLDPDPTTGRPRGSERSRTTAIKTGSERFLEKCAVRGILLRQIYFGELSGSKHIEDEVDEEFINVLVIPGSSSEHSGSFEKYIYEGKVCLISPTTSYAIIIEDEYLYQFESLLFESSWKKYYKTNKVLSE